MLSWRFPVAFLMVVSAILAVDLAVMRSLLRHHPGSNQMVFLVPIDGTTWIPFAALALGVLPMASLLVLTAAFQVPKVRRTRTVSGFWLGFEVAGWFSVFLYMISSSLSPGATQTYLFTAAAPVGPLFLQLMGNEPSTWLLDGVELAAATIVLVLPELLLALAAGWLLGRRVAFATVVPCDSIGRTGEDDP